MDATLQEVLTLGGAPLLRAVFILSCIVSVIVCFKQVIDLNGSGSRQEGIQKLTVMIMASYLLLVIFRFMMARIGGISISGIDFS